MLTEEQRYEVLAMNRAKYPIPVRKFTCSRCGRVETGKWSNGAYIMPGWLFLADLGNRCPDCAKIFKQEYEERCRKAGTTSSW